MKKKLVSSEGSSPAIGDVIFVNRNLKMGNIKAIGFDMDHTLAVYRVPEIEALAFRCALSSMVKDMGYDRRLLKLPYRSGMMIRGLMMDIQLGNFLKTDRHKYVVQARHGVKLISSKERKKVYQNERVNPSLDRFRSIDTFFEIPEAYLYSHCVEFADNSSKKGARPNYRKIYKDVRKAIDHAHRCGCIKDKVQKKPSAYLRRDQLLPHALARLKRSGKKIFLLTNSGFEYTDSVMTFILGGMRDDFPRWQDYFELIVTESVKPKFYQPLRGWRSRRQSSNKSKKLVVGGNYQQMEDFLGCRGDRILYFGDHTFGDILRSKKGCGWRTAMVAPEVSSMISSSSDLTPRPLEIESNRMNRRLSQAYNRLYQLHAEKLDFLNKPDLRRLRSIDEEILKLTGRLTEMERRCTDFVKERLQRRLPEKRFNRYWGDPFFAGDIISRFADQMRDWACIYTAKASNLYYYGGQHYFRVRRVMLPHEKFTQDFGG